MATKKKVEVLTSFMGRELSEGDLVEVHYNLHEGGFSITNVESGLVVARAPYVYLTNVTTKVSEKSRQRVIREGSKNVHAKIVGNYTKQELDMSGARVLTYNPYKYETFVDKETEQSVLQAIRAKCVEKGALYV
jgi:hypothetical protein